MSAVVTDASAALAWVLRSQETTAAAAFLAGSDSMVFEAPAIFEWEVRNVLLSLDRRGVLARSDYDDALARYEDLEVRLHQAHLTLRGLATLAREARLSLFDASYLALAMGRGWPLASRDAALLAAARRGGVTCFDLR